MNHLLPPERCDVFLFEPASGYDAEVAGWLFPESVTIGLLDSFVQLKRSRKYRDCELTVWYDGNDSFMVLGIDSSLPDNLKKIFRRNARGATGYAGLEAAADPMVHDCTRPLVKYTRERIVIFGYADTRFDPFDDENYDLRFEHETL